MAESLKSFASFNDDSRDEVRVTIGKQTFPILTHFDGETCWERCHPTFISKKRKVILTCPRKVGHSSIRFYLNAQNEMFNDDWVWIEDQNRNPKTWLTDEEYLKFVTDMWQPNKRVIMHSYENLPKHWVEAADGEYNPLTKNAKIIKRGSEESKEFLGDNCPWDYGMKATPKNYREGRDSEMTPPFQDLNFFKDWTSYLLVRDPWERFISGLITEMDNGMSCPWIYDMDADTEEGWERYYNSAKRIIYFCPPERLLIGGLEGQQMNHTFVLSRPMWNGKSMYDTYDNFIHYKHDIDYTKTELGHMYPSQESLKKTAGAIETLIELDFINDKVRQEYQQNQSQNMYAHTHMNVTPEIRQRVMEELQKDEDLKEWWDTCREYVQMDYDALKINKQKFLKT
tara:strand:+ start:17668 stop:18861 length:1194 start_codon:yes stop_codon:yes gene_type:complete